LLDDQLFMPDGELSTIASRVVLEIMERASLDGIRDVRSRIASLRKLGFRIAVDDLGAGYAGLTSFTLLEPDIVKLDMALVRNVHQEPKKRTVVRTMISMCKELGIVVTSEGIETPERFARRPRVASPLSSREAQDDGQARRPRRARRSR
jgi:EAL domain-containing protein (putative c-di-GMP-specific phosphodiesterase class I)